MCVYSITTSVRKNEETTSELCMPTYVQATVITPGRGQARFAQRLVEAERYFIPTVSCEHKYYAFFVQSSDLVAKVGLMLFPALHMKIPQCFAHD